MNTLINNREIIFMVWETNPSLRNKNNKIKAYIKPAKNLNIGDRIKGSDLYFRYEVTDILGRRKSSHTEYDYVYFEYKYKKI